MTTFDPSDCPLDCFRACEAVCPANAIVLKKGDSLETAPFEDLWNGMGDFVSHLRLVLVRLNRATREALAFVVCLAAAEDRPPGNVEDGNLSGSMSGSHNSLIAGIAYGGYARKIVGRILRAMQSHHGLASVEDHPTYLSAAVGEALALVGSVKCYAELRVDRD
ncbi:Methionine--tRNA ligase [Bienertia sinuspersici]